MVRKDVKKTKKPVAKKKPVTKKTITKKPVAKKPITKKPVAKKTITKKPAKKRSKKQKFLDSGLVIVDDDIEIDKEKVNEERKAYLEEARSQEAFD